MAILDYYKALSNSLLKERCVGAILKFAKPIAIEATSVPNHDKRRELALDCIQNGVQWPRWERWVVTDGTVGAKVTALDTLTDPEIESLILTIWDNVAGVPLGA